MKTIVQQELPEITLKALILAAILTITLAAANAFLGLKVGLTISASIPSAVISMGLLRFFKHHNALENNIVQTAASAGEALTAGIIFTLPALIVMHCWTEFKYWPTVVIAMLGGIFGVLFSVPLRRVLLEDKTLAFPEGTAIGNVLKISDRSDFGINHLLMGGIVGALISLFQSGFKLIQDTIQVWFTIGKLLFGFGIGFNPAMIGAGYIIGINVGVAIAIGIVLGWIIGVPVIAYLYGIPFGNTDAEIAMVLWSQYIRFIGVGVMMVGGIAAIFTLAKPTYLGIKKSFHTVTHIREQGYHSIPRVERDVPIHIMLMVMAILIIPLALILYYLITHQLSLGWFTRFEFSVASLLYVLIGGFVLSSVCAYFAGLVGSSANPLSSLALVALIFASLMTMIILHDKISLSANSVEALGAAGIVICLTALMSAMASISNDTIQDLKAGQMLGATPWKQQVMLMFGVILASFIIPYILTLLFNAYGLAGVFPRQGMDPAQMLLAPQAGLMAAVVNSLFLKTMNLAMLVTGGIIAVICLIIDKWLSVKKGWRLSLLAVGLGIYLPIDTTTPLVIGGLLSLFTTQLRSRRAAQLLPVAANDYVEVSCQRGLLIASGLVAGSALMGVVLAIPFAMKGSTDALRLISPSHEWFPIMAAVIILSGLCVWMVRRIVR